MRKKKPNKYLLVCLLVIFTYCLYNMYMLVSKSYVVSNVELCKIDTFHLLGHATVYADIGRPHNEYLTFKSANRYTFRIPSEYYSAINNRSHLIDTLLYHNTMFIVYSNKETLEKYQKCNSPFPIDVLQIEIGNQKYINLALLNKQNKKRILRNILIPGVLSFFALFMMIKIMKGYRPSKSD